MGVLQSPQPPASESILTTLINEITAIPDSFVLVLDDYHVIDAKAVGGALTFLLQHLPPQMHLVIATREDPRLPLARLRARNQLTELRAADLRFAASEAAEFLNQVMGLDLAAEDIAALELRTEGWIAGLQLAAISMQGRQDTAGFIRSFTGGHHFVLDYLVEEVLQQQSASVQGLLLRTSILDRMCGPLCDAVLLAPTGSGQVTLQYLERANLFVAPLDNERRWYRYHRLFADLLRQRLQQSGNVAEYHVRASLWYEDNGLEIEAFQHAAAANDVERAERLIEGKGIPLQFRGVVTTILDWLASLPKTVLDARPALWVRYARLLMVTGQTTGVEEKLQVRFTAIWTLGFACLLQGDRAAAARAFAEALSISREAGDTHSAIVATTGLGQVQEMANDLHLAADSYRRVLQLAGDTPQPVVSEAHLSLARVFYEWNDLDTAEQHGQQSLQLARQFDKAIDRFVICEVFLARLRLARGDVAGAAAMLAQTEQSVRQSNFVHRMGEVAAARVLALLRQGSVAAAARLAQAHDLPLSRARVLLAQGNVTAALAALEPLRQQMEARGWQDQRLKVMVLQALAHHVHGEKDRALQLLGEALALAEPGGFVRLFVDEGPPMARLLSAAAAQGMMPGYVGKLLSASAAEEQLAPAGGRAGPRKGQDKSPARLLW